MAVQSVYAKTSSIGLDGETLKLLNVELIDRDGGVAGVLDAGDGQRAKGEDVLFDAADFADAQSGGVAVRGGGWAGRGGWRSMKNDEKFMLVRKVGWC